jgi:UDP:flavonoid glycosyltransferase YjiC (YdhE family)
VEIGKVLRSIGQDVKFFSHGGPYESVARGEGFEVSSIQPTMSPERAEEFIAFNRAERGNPLKDSFFTYEELETYVRYEAEALREAQADAVLIGWNLPSYLSVQLVGIPIIVQQPGSFISPF